MTRAFFSKFYNLIPHFFKTYTKINPQLCKNCTKQDKYPLINMKNTLTATLV